VSEGDSGGKCSMDVNVMWIQPNCEYLENTRLLSLFFCLADDDDGSC
jgi:hypothetical protein